MSFSKERRSSISSAIRSSILTLWCFTYLTSIYLVWYLFLLLRFIFWTCSIQPLVVQSTLPTAWSLPMVATTCLFFITGTLANTYYYISHSSLPRIRFQHLRPNILYSIQEHLQFFLTVSRIASISLFNIHSMRYMLWIWLLYTICLICMSQFSSEIWTTLVLSGLENCLVPS